MCRASSRERYVIVFPTGRRVNIEHAFEERLFRKEIIRERLFPFGGKGGYLQVPEMSHLGSSVASLKGLESCLIMQLQQGRGQLSRERRKSSSRQAGRDQVPNKGIGSKWGYTLHSQEAWAGCVKSRAFSS